MQPSMPARAHNPFLTAIPARNTRYTSNLRCRDAVPASLTTTQLTAAKSQCAHPSWHDTVLTLNRQCPACVLTSVAHDCPHTTCTNVTHVTCPQRQQASLPAKTPSHPLHSSHKAFTSLPNKAHQQQTLTGMQLLLSQLCRARLQVHPPALLTVPRKIKVNI
jgi:hypothetical protein